MNLRTTKDWTDGTLVVAANKKFLKVGSPQEWVAAIRAGYVINGPIRPVKGSPAAVSLRMLTPELGRYVSAVAREVAEDGLSQADMVEFVAGHAAYFSSLKAANQDV